MSTSKNINDQALQSLQDLFSSAPAEQLYQTIEELFFVWLIESPNLPEHYKQMTEDVYFLLEFLKKVKDTGLVSRPPYNIKA